MFTRIYWVGIKH